MENIYLSPSSQPENKYAVGNTNEQEQCRKIASVLEKKLVARGLPAAAGLSGTMYTRVAESNKMKSKLHLPIHSNAANGKVGGLRIFVYKMGGEAEKIAKAIMETLAPITPGTSDSISAQPGLYEIYASDAICVYIEVGFHDNPEEAQWIIDHTEDIAEAICKGLCNYYGVENPEESVYTIDQFIREVQAAIGAKVDGIAGPETLSKTVTVSRYKNDYHKVVAPIQRRLDSLGYDVGTVDGEAGAKFDSALKAFQKDNGCVVDGEATARQKTWKKLLEMI